MLMTSYVIEQALRSNFPLKRKGNCFPVYSVTLNCAFTIKIDQM